MINLVDEINNFGGHTKYITNMKEYEILINNVWMLTWIGKIDKINIPVQDNMLLAKWIFSQHGMINQNTYWTSTYLSACMIIKQYWFFITFWQGILINVRTFKSLQRLIPVSREIRTPGYCYFKVLISWEIYPASIGTSPHYTPALAKFLQTVKAVAGRNYRWSQGREIKTFRV